MIMTIAFLIVLTLLLYLNYKQWQLLDRWRKAYDELLKATEQWQAIAKTKVERMEANTVKNWSSIIGWYLRKSALTKHRVVSRGATITIHIGNDVHLVEIPWQQFADDPYAALQAATKQWVRETAIPEPNDEV